MAGLLALPANIRLARKTFSVANTVAYLSTSSVTKKKFYNIDTWSQKSPLSFTKWLLSVLFTRWKTFKASGRGISGKLLWLLHFIL